MAKMTKNQLIDAIAEGTQVSKGDVKAVIEQMATVGYKELNESGEFVIPGFVKMSVVNKPATEARQRQVQRSDGFRCEAVNWPRLQSKHVTWKIKSADLTPALYN